MKKSLIFLTIILIAVTVWAQCPEKMTYQAVIRDANDALLTNTTIGMQISILQGSSSGTSIYTEIHMPTTNVNGLATLEIGAGSTSDDFSAIDWRNGPYYIKTEADPLGGNNYTITGISQLLSVPYALHSKTSESITGTINEVDPVYSSSQAANITATDIIHLSNLSGINSGDQDLSNLATINALADSTAQVRGEIPDVTGFVTNEVDPVYAASQAANITATDITNLSNLSGTNTGDQDGSETKITAGTNVTLTGTGTIANPYVVNATGTTPPILSIGQNYQGGIIFWLDATGQHGLIVSAVDQNPGELWYNGTSRYTGGSGDGLYAGKMNTSIIVATQIGDNQTESFAAKTCADYTVIDGAVTYGDWYLPSIYELNLLYLQKDVIGGLSGPYYWSSTEYSHLYAWKQSFINGTFIATAKNDSGCKIRAIRAF